MKKYPVFILVLVIVSGVALFGCENKKTDLPPAPSAQTAVTPPAPERAPAPAPAPAKPAKK